MKVLVLGAGGFVGRNLSQKLKDIGGYNVIEKFSCDFDMRYPVVFPAADICYVLAPGHGINKCNKDPFGTFDSYVIGTKNVINACINAKIKKIVLLSSVWVYDIIYNPSELDSARGNNNAGFYGKWKSISESIVESFSKKNGIECTIFRASYIYGNSAKKGLIFDIINTHMFKSRFSIDSIISSIHINDVINALILPCSCTLPGIFNLSSNNPTKLEDILSYKEEGSYDCSVGTNIYMVIDSLKLVKYAKWSCINSNLLEYVSKSFKYV